MFVHITQHCIKWNVIQANCSLCGICIFKLYLSNCTRKHRERKLYNGLHLNVSVHQISILISQWFRVVIGQSMRLTILFIFEWTWHRRKNCSAWVELVWVGIIFVSDMYYARSLFTSSCHELQSWSKRVHNLMSKILSPMITYSLFGKTYNHVSTFPHFSFASNTI